MRNSIESKPKGRSEPAGINHQPTAISDAVAGHTKYPAEAHASSDPDSPQFLSRRQVARRWNCCEHTVARRRDLKPVRFNARFLRYRREDVETLERGGAA